MTRRALRLRTRGWSARSPTSASLRGDVLGRLALVAVSPAAVDRLEAQQIAAQLDDFGLGARHPSIVTRWTVLAAYRRISRGV